VTHQHVSNSDALRCARRAIASSAPHSSFFRMVHWRALRFMAQNRVANGITRHSSPPGLYQQARKTAPLAYALGNR
jgi:hypothetical protein